MNQRFNEEKIIEEIKQAAIDHLNSNSAEEAMSHFTKDIVAVSNEMLFSKYDALEKDVGWKGASSGWTMPQSVCASRR